MEQLKIADRYKKILRDFTHGLNDIYRDELLSLILYGSAVSGEFVDKHSNLNVLVVLKNTDLEVIKKASRFLRGFRMITALFLSEEYIARSTDIFPIEFLDMQENYFLLHGRDVLKDIHIDLRNLRFQCEQELKAKLLKLRQAYALLNDKPSALRTVLFLSFTSVVHIARNVLRIQGKKPAYLKQDVLKELVVEFKIDLPAWEKILAAKNKKVVLSKGEIEQLFVAFTRDVESMAAIVDRL